MALTIRVLALPYVTMLMALPSATTAQGSAARGADLEPATDVPVPIVRLMPVGDSITQGGQGYASWRYPFWFSLLGSGVVLDFVGDQTTVFGESGFNPDPLLYPAYTTWFDRDHQGHWGFRTDQMLEPAFFGAEAGLPDVVTVHLGTNDIGQSGAAGVTNVDQYLPRIIGNVRSVVPTARFLVAQVVPIGPGTSYSANAAQVAPLNASIANIATALTSAASPIRVVDQNTGFDVNALMQTDGLHPNELGERRIARVWRDALFPLLALPEPQAQPAALVANADFEALGTTEGTVLEDPPGIDWFFGATSNVARGIFNPGSDTYTGAAGAGTPVGGAGDEVAYLYTYGGAFERVSLVQTLATTLEPATTYTLTVAVGNRLPTNPYGPSTWGGYRIELLAGNTVIASEEDAMTPTAGTFADASVAVDSVTLPPELVGAPLSIRCSMTLTASGSSTDFDHVRLTAN